MLAAKTGRQLSKFARGIPATKTHARRGEQLGLPARAYNRGICAAGDGDCILFQQLARLKEDSILGLMARFREDPSPDKVDLGVGVFRDLTGNTPVLDCIRRAEQAVLAAETTKTYVAAAGRAEFNSQVAELVLGTEHAALRDGRARVLQTPGGCGALRVGAELTRAAAPGTTVHISSPTWGNHASLLGSSGLRLAEYPYYDATGHRLRFDAMLERLDGAPAGDIVLLHACCHNPTGADLSLEQWRVLGAVLARRGLTPFLDLAYQGFGEDLERDAAGLRLLSETLPEALIAVSFSKNLGLYRERVGALIVVTENPSQAEAVRTHMLQIARSIYSMPPDHGAALAAHVFADPGLRSEWTRELATMRRRIEAMRSLLSQQLRAATGTPEFDFLAGQRGMFSQLGCSAEAVALLRERHHIYMLGDSRMNLAGVMPQNAAYVAECIASVTRKSGAESVT
jgi:aspartate aminotransferase